MAEVRTANPSSSAQDLKAAAMLPSGPWLGAARGNPALELVSLHGKSEPRSKQGPARNCWATGLLPEDHTSQRILTVDLQLRASLCHFFPLRRGGGMRTGMGELMWHVSEPEQVS